MNLALLKRVALSGAAVAVAAGCNPKLLDDCKTDDDCAAGVCRVGYCVLPADGAADGAVSVDASGSDSTVTSPDAAVVTSPDAAVVTSPDAAVVTSPDAAVVTPSDAAVVTPPDAAVVTPPDAAVVTSPDAFVPPPPALVGACAGDRSLLPLWTPFGQPCITLDTAALWAFNGSYDARGGGGRHLLEGENDGLDVGAVTYVPSLWDQAISFAGNPDLWQGATVRSVVRNEAPTTVEMWVRLPVGSHGGTLISNIDSPGSPCHPDGVSAGWQLGFVLQADGAGYLLTLENWDGLPRDTTLGEQYTLFDEGPILDPSVWHHVAVVFEGEGDVSPRAWAWADTFTLGDAQNVHFGPSAETSYLTFGTRADCWGEEIQIDMESVRIMGRALSEEELQASPQPVEAPPEPPPPPAPPSEP